MCQSVESETGIWNTSYPYKVSFGFGKTLKVADFFSFLIFKWHSSCRLLGIKFNNAFAWGELDFKDWRKENFIRQVEKKRQVMTSEHHLRQ